MIADLNLDSAQQTASKISSAGGSAVAIAVDVSSRSSVRALIDETVSRFGRLDVMFNNAGISQTCPFMEVTDEDFDGIMAINGRGVLIGTQEAARQMIAQGDGGKIVNTASIAGKQGYALFAHYCASNSRLLRSRRRLPARSQNTRSRSTASARVSSKPSCGNSSTASSSSAA